MRTVRTFGSLAWVYHTTVELPLVTDKEESFAIWSGLQYLRFSIVQSRGRIVGLKQSNLYRLSLL